MERFEHVEKRDDVEKILRGTEFLCIHKFRSLEFQMKKTTAMI